jgi:hypothetical protein
MNGMIAAIAIRRSSRKDRELFSKSLMTRASPLVDNTKGINYNFPDII